jgi:aryl-alcohol dehydrogenase-like predicted oxidoreductase
LAYNVLAKGLLTGKFGSDDRWPENDRRSRLPMFQGDEYEQALQRVREISVAARDAGLTCAQFSIAQVVKRAEVTSAILGIKNRQQIEENCSFLAQKSAAHNSQILGR